MRLWKIAGLAALPFVCATAGASSDAGAGGGDPEVDAASWVRLHVAARGGAERWRAVRSLELTGVYSAFSFHEPFRLLRSRGDLYRLDYVVLGSPAVRARDGQGPWWLEPLLQPQAGRVDEDPYKSQLERESLFGPPLLDPEGRGIEVELLGPGEVDGRATIDLELTFPDGGEEIWHLDPETGLEVAVDAQVFDFTQGNQPMRRRTFFDDFREVEGLVLPFQVDHEFGARLEAMTVERVRIDPEITAEDLAPPPPEPAADGDGDGGEAEPPAPSGS